MRICQSLGVHRQIDKLCTMAMRCLRVKIPQSEYCTGAITHAVGGSS